MRPVNEKLRVDLLEAGKREFMESGFRGASLKSIAASLGVTTGAIYRYYTDKEALFDGLVREPAQELVERYLHGSSFCRDDQVCGKLHVGHPYQLYERYCQLVRTGGS